MGGWYLSGIDADGHSEQLAGGQLKLSGQGCDNPGFVCGAGVAKAYDQVPLGDLSALSYGWHVDRVAGDQAPTIHVMVTGLTTTRSSRRASATPA